MSRVGEITHRLVRWLERQVSGEQMRGLIKRASAVLMTQVAGAAAMFLTGIFLGRWLGAEAYGQYSFAITFVIVLRIVAALGLPMMMMRTVAVYFGDQDWPRLKGLLRFAGLTAFGSGAITATIAAVGIVLFAPSPRPPVADLILMTLPLLLVLPMADTAANAIRGLHQVSAGQVTEFARSVLNLAFLFAAIFLFHVALTPESAIWLRLAAEAVGMFVTLYLLLKLLPKALAAATPRMELTAWRKGQLSFLAVDAMYLIYQQADVLILGFLRPLHEVGVYRMAANLSFILVFASVIASAALAPLAASAWAAGKKRELRDSAMRLSRLAFGLTFLLYLILLASTPLLIGILGDDFSGIVAPLAILGLGQVVRALMSAAPTIVLMTGAEKKGARGIAVSAVLNVVLNIVLAHFFGMIGAAIATAASTIFLSLYYVFIAHRHTGISGTVVNLAPSAQS